MTSDLVVVVADGGIEQAVRGILSRPERLRIRPLLGLDFPKLRQLDAGTFELGHELAKPYRKTHRHALVILDTAWDGAPSAAQIVDKVEFELGKTWGDRGRCIAIDPELEVWLWSDSPHVAAALGWDNMIDLRTWLASKGLWPDGIPKPLDPKAAYLAAIREKRVPRSNATFTEIASKISFSRCQDGAFRRLTAILSEWFSAPGDPG
jgi:hypothetical protein